MTSSRTDGAVSAAQLNGTYYGSSIAGGLLAAADATSEVLPVIGTARKALRRDWTGAALSLTLDVLTLGEGNFVAAAAGEAGGGGLFASVLAHSGVDLRGFLRFAHGTAPESVASVTKALDAVKAAASGFQGSAWRRGSFYATELGVPGSAATRDALEVAYMMGARHAGSDAVVMIGQIPRRIADQLFEQGALAFETVDGVRGIVIHPQGFPLFNEAVSWLQVLTPGR